MVDIIETVDLTKTFDSLVAVEELRLSVKKGEVLGLLGPNGAGKTTIVRMLSGIIAPTRGYAVVAGIRTDEKVEQLHEVIGLLTEIPGFYERLSARRNLQFFAEFYPSIDADVQLERYLKVMGLWGRRDDKVAHFFEGDEAKIGSGTGHAPRSGGIVLR